MENLKYVIEDARIIELLGIGNFSNENSAILELVKNAYDAGSSIVTIKFANDENGEMYIEISDDGNGMDDNDIKNKWMHVGASSKKYFVSGSSSSNIKFRKESRVDLRAKSKSEYVFKGFKNARIAAGSMGIGRFALARLSEETTMFSKKRGEEETVRWFTDWSRTELTKNIAESIKISGCGTKFILKKLRRSWDENSVNNLKEYLSRSYKGNGLTINIDYGGITYPIRDLFYHPQVGINYTSKINFSYDSKTKETTINILCDEFESKISEIVDIDTFPILKSKTINNVEYFNTNSVYRKKINDFYGGEIEDILIALGDFSGEFYFNLQNVGRVDKERFFYKYNTLRKKFESGVILYRNSFSISSYDGSKDWLNLSKRASESPAAASHPTGKWRVNTAQLSGNVLIDRRQNNYLVDLSNRQGLDENVFYHMFIDVISIVLSIFEEFRQGIVRKLKVYDENRVTKAQNVKKESLKDIIKTPETILHLDNTQLLKTAQDFSSYASNVSILEKSSKEKEEKYIYEIRILNVLATSGLKAMSIAHELDNKRNNISANYERIVKALIKYNMWGELQLEKNKARSHRDVPRLLEQNKTVSEKLVTFLDTILEEVEIQFFDIEKINVEEFICSLIEKWKIDYPSVLEIKYKKRGEERKFCMSKDILNVVLDNLILNSIQQNEKRITELKISIEYELKYGIFYLTYKDNGVGLSGKYIKDPMKILDIHESSREKGHGLGMWMVNNSVISSDGKVTNIKGHDGFSFECVLLEQEEIKKGDKHE